MQNQIQSIPVGNSVVGDKGRREKQLWLLALGILVYAIVLVGGATRLTDSGLSITEWDLVRGSLPPLSQAEWQILFDKYRQTTEYQTQNRGMSFGDFQFIFWWEWGHRLFARLVGLVAVAGFVWFAARRWLDRKRTIRFGALIALGGLQGLVGWWMVASGIGETTRVDVAPYRLMTHFSLALLILCLITWFWLDHSRIRQSGVVDSARRAAMVLLALTSVQMAAGALVAGLDAGRSYTDWPLMHGEFFPSDYWRDDYGVRNPFENRATTQFNHRFLAYVLWGLSLWAAWRFRATALGKGFVVFAGLVSLQAVWGILTLVYAAPLTLALIHQALGVIVLLKAVTLVWRSQPARSEPAAS